MAVKTPPRDHSHSPPSERHVSDHSDKENEEPEGEPQQVKQSKKDKSKAKKRPHESGDHSSGNSKKTSKDQEEFRLPSQGPLIPPTLEDVQQEVLALEDQVARYKCDELEDRLNTVVTVVQQLATVQSDQANTWRDEIGKLTAALTTAQEQNATLIEAIHKNTGSGVKIVECIESKPILNAGMTTLEVNMAEIKQTQNTIISSINVMQSSIGKLEQNAPSKSKTILAHADQFASKADGLVLTSHCNLCKRSNHSTAQCRQYTSPAERYQKALELKICLACLELVDGNPQEHRNCSSADLRCNRCMSAGATDTLTNHAQIFCLRADIDSNRKGRKRRAVDNRPPRQ